MSETKVDIKVGDWICFPQDGRLLIGAVVYLLTEASYPYRVIAYTDVGAVAVDYVLEGRR